MILNVNVTGLESIRSQFLRLGRAPQDALDKTAVEVEDYIHTQTAPHTQNSARTRGSEARAGLEKSLSKVRFPGGWEIGHDSRVAPYARFVHDGTRPHLIVPNKKKILRWASGGLFHFAKVVHHPGNKPDKWMERAAAKAPAIFQQHLEQLLRA